MSDPIPTPSGQLVGYSRTSITDKNAALDAQLHDLTEAGCVKVFREETPSVAAPRPERRRALDYVRDGDTLIVTNLDRLAHSMADLVEITQALKAKGVALRILTSGLDTGTAAGQPVVDFLGSLAEFERAIAKERQREGIARVVGNQEERKKKYKGRPKMADEKRSQVLLMKAGGNTAKTIGKALGIGTATVYRVLKEAGGPKAG